MSTRDRPHEHGTHGPTWHGRRQPDVFVQVLHTILVLAFVGAWLSAEWPGLRSWHIVFGHVMAGALSLRIAWSLVRPASSLGCCWRLLARSLRRVASGRAGALRPAAWSIATGALLVCSMVVLVVACFITGWALGLMVDAPQGPVNLHHWAGTALMLTVASHVAFVAVLGVLRGRCDACAMLPFGGTRLRGS